MIELEKTDCADSISFGLNHTSGWRRKKAVLYPTDARNTRASESLSRLASDAAGLTDDDFLLLQPYFGFDSARWREAVSKAARHVGFTYKIRDFPSFIQHLVDVLDEPVVA